MHVALRCPAGEALRQLWDALDQAEAQVAKLPPTRATAALADALVAARWRLRAAEKAHDQPGGCPCHADPS